MASLMFNPAGQVMLIIISQEQVISAVAGIKYTPCCRNKTHPFCRNKMHPCCGNKMHPFCRKKMHPCCRKKCASVLLDWNPGIWWKLNVVWHCKSHLGMEKRRRWLADIAMQILCLAFRSLRPTLSHSWCMKHNLIEKISDYLCRTLC